MQRRLIFLLLASFFRLAVGSEESPRLVAPLLVVGPLSDIPPTQVDATGAEEMAFISEVDPTSLWPAVGESLGWFGSDGDLAWRTVGEGGEVPGLAGKRTLHFVAGYITLDRRDDVGFTASGSGGLRLYIDGEECVKGGAPGDDATEVSHRGVLTRGMHRLLLRVERDGSDGATPTIAVTVETTVAEWVTSVERRHPLTEYNELRGMATISGLSLSPDGQWLALSRGGKGDVPSGLNIVRTSDGMIVAQPLGAGARGVAWSPDSQSLLIREGTSLYLWQRGDGSVRAILEDEPGLGDVSWSANGRLLVFASTRGAPKGRSGNRRRVELRERLSDWPTEPHLHLFDVVSKARRRLTVSGDWLQDSFQLSPESRRLVFLRNVPIAQRPWFATDVCSLDLATGVEKVVRRVVMGFENRPGMSGMSLSPDGRRLAFIGPPCELGDDVETEPNAFDPDLFTIDLEDGSLTNVSLNFAASVSGNLSWSADSKSLYFTATNGSRDQLVAATFAEGSEARMMFGFMDVGGEVIHSLSLSLEGRFAAVTSDTNRLPQLSIGQWLGDVAPTPLITPNRGLSERLELATPTDASFALDDGTPIEAWLYRPVGPFASSPTGKLPLVVYYYGGATPTKRGFNELHQFLVGHGYALLVINPRGANGYGREFADSHAADWGARAGGDILLGVERALAENPDLDRERIGCYGGSYGGFMTMYLVSHSDRFAAAVSMYGISNLASYWGDGIWGWTYGDQAMARKYPWSDPEWFARQSPLYVADRIDTPLLLLHGEVDTNVPIAESEQMFTALRLLNKPVELVRFPGEDHGLRGTWENRVAHRSMLLEWFDRYLRDRGEAWSARWDD